MAMIDGAQRLDWVWFALLEVATRVGTQPTAEDQFRVLGVAGVELADPHPATPRLSARSRR